MRLLLDTQPLIHAVDRPASLPSPVREAIEDAANTVFVSVISPLEMQIKVNLGKLKLASSPVSLVEQEIARGTFALLPISLAHIDALSRLPAMHRDPFDRLLIAQPICEGLTIVTGDRAIARYPVLTLWA